MRLLITGADQAMGAALCRGLASEGEVVAVGDAATPGYDLGAAGYRRLELADPEAVGPAVAEADAVVHAWPHGLAGADGQDGADLLERVSRGTYVLACAARDAGLPVVVISRVELFDAYPEDFRVTAHWRPRPRPEAEALTPWMAELICRELARAGRIEAAALRMGALEAPTGTSAADAVAAVRHALDEDTRRDDYRWSEAHVVSGGRYADV